MSGQARGPVTGASPPLRAKVGGQSGVCLCYCSSAAARLPQLPVPVGCVVSFTSSFYLIETYQVIALIVEEHILNRPRLNWGRSMITRLPDPQPQVLANS